jgi:hypothetical protein
METKEKLIYVDIYADTTGQYTEAEIIRCNCVSVQIPERIVRQWFEEKAKPNYDWGPDFKEWLKDLYTCDDTDGLYQFSVDHGYCPICGRKCDDCHWFE